MERIQIKKIASLLALMCLCLTHYTFAEDINAETQSALQLKKNGFKECAHAVDDIGHFVFQGDFAYLNLWNQTNVDKHSVLVTGAKTYSVGKGLLTITATESQVKTCDASFTLVMPFPEDCAQLRQTINLSLQPFQGGCLAVKTGLFFLSTEK
jgi:hypothetical protein